MSWVLYTVKDIAEVLLISLILWLCWGILNTYEKVAALAVKVQLYYNFLNFSLQARDDEPQITMFGQDLPFIKESAADSSLLALSLPLRTEECVMRSFVKLVAFLVTRNLQ